MPEAVDCDGPAQQHVLTITRAVDEAGEGKMGLCTCGWHSTVVSVSDSVSMLHRDHRRKALLNGQHH